MSNNNQNQNPGDTHANYPHYIAHAISKARELGSELRTTCRLPESPKSGDLLYEMPVYEPINQKLPSNLFTYTRNNVIRTKLTIVYKTPTHVDAYFAKYIDSTGKESVHIIVTDQNPCWTRFLATKEIMHCYIHKSGDETNTPADLKNLIISIINETGASSDTAQSIVDDAAYYGAVEYLIPSDTVPLLKAALEVLKSEPVTEKSAYLILAKRIRVPESILEFRLNNDVIFTLD